VAQVFHPTKKSQVAVTFHHAMTSIMPSRAVLLMIVFLIQLAHSAVLNSSGTSFASNEIPKMSTPTLLRPRASMLQPAKSTGEPHEGSTHEESEMDVELEIAEEHEESSHVADAVALMLLGMVSFQISLFHLVNFPDKDVQHFTWMSLSQTTSIFCAVLVWTTLKMTIEYCFGEQPGDGRVTSKGTEATVMIVFICMFVVVELALSALRHRHSSLHVLGTLGAHTVGFAAVDAFGEIQQTAPWRDNPVFSFADAFTTMLVLFVLCFVATQVRKHYAIPLESTEDHEVIERWEEVSCEFEDEFCGFVVGLLNTSSMIYAVTGYLPPIQGSPFNRTRQEVQSLGLCAVGIGILLICFIIFTHKMREIVENKAVLRAFDVTESVLAMTFGWCFLFTGRWLFWVSTNDQGVGDGDIMSARMVQALVFSFFVLAMIFPLDFLADNNYIDEKGMRALMASFGLLLGLSWEGAFDQAIEALGREMQDTPQMQFLTMVSMSVALCIVVLPAWAMYVLPAALDGKAHFSGNDKEEESPRMVVAHD